MLQAPICYDGRISKSQITAEIITCRPNIQGVTKASIFDRNLPDSQKRSQCSRFSYLLQRPERTQSRHCLPTLTDICDVSFWVLSLGTSSMAFAQPLRIILVTPLLMLIFHDRSGVACAFMFSRRCSTHAEVGQ